MGHESELVSITLGWNTEILLFSLLLSSIKFEISDDDLEVKSLDKSWLSSLLILSYGLTLFWLFFLLRELTSLALKVTNAARRRWKIIEVTPSGDSAITSGGILSCTFPFLNFCLSFWLIPIE